MIIWVTGAAGFLGSYLADSFADEGHLVVGIDNLIGGTWDNIKNTSVEKEIVDCCDRDALRRLVDSYGTPDIVYHCAATAHEGLSVFSPSFITRNIFEASVSVFSVAAEVGVKRIINCTSMARYGSQTTPFTEDMTPRPQDPYGVAKVAAEDVLRILAEVHEFEYIIAVPHNIIGVRQCFTDPFRNVASIMMNRVKQGKPIIVYGDGTQRRCFSPIEDCLHCLKEMANLNRKDLVGQIINIGPDGNGVSILELTELIKEISNTQVDIQHYPDRPQEVKHALCSSDKARSMLGYVEQKNLLISLQEMWDAIPEGGAPFEYANYPVEIINEKTPKTWSNKEM